MDEWFKSPPWKGGTGATLSRVRIPPSPPVVFPSIIANLGDKLNVIGILLAAGHSRRFGSVNKLTQALPDGIPVAVKAAQHLVAAMPDSIAIIRPEHAELGRLLADQGLQVIVCTEQEQEMADSLSAAVSFASETYPQAQGFVIALADMPFIQPGTIAQVARQISAGDAIVMPSYQGRRGHPVGFAVRFVKELASLRGDSGARSILERYPAELTVFECGDAGILRDIDMPADLPNR